MQTLVQFYAKHKRTILATLGILMITGSLAALYWSSSSTVASKGNTVSSKSIERMKAKGLLGNSSSATSNKSSPASLMSGYMEKKAEQNRILLIIVAIGGVLALLYSFIKKDEKAISAK